MSEEKGSLNPENQIVKISMPTYHVVDNVVLYEVDVSNKKSQWNLSLRYEAFFNLHEELQEYIQQCHLSIFLPPFPEKRIKFFTNHFDENRRILLENYLQKILNDEHLKHCEAFVSCLAPREKEDKEKMITTHIVNEHNNDELNNNQGNQDNNEDNNEDDNETERDKTKPTFQHNPKDEHCIDLSENDEITAVCIPQSKILRSDHVVYAIHVFNANLEKSFQRWTVLKRFDEFHRFDREFREIMINDYPYEMKLMPPLPPKYMKVLIDHLEETFVEKRRLLLQGYLQCLIKYPLFRRHKMVSQFLGIKTSN